MADEETKDKKIIIDEDWKAEAQKEKAKAKLNAEESAAESATKEEELAKESAAAESGDEEGQRGALPEGNFAGLLSMLMIQTLSAMGVPLVEGQEQRTPDLELARYHIDMLGTLEEKTKGNLTDQEEAVLTQTLSDLRMSYVRLAGGGAKAD